MSVLVLSYWSFSKYEVGFPDPLAWAADLEAAGEEGAEWGVCEEALLVFLPFYYVPAFGQIILPPCWMP